MNKIGNITKNTSYLTIALILQKVISFSYFVILARNLLPADLGQYYFAISFVTIFAIVIDLGLMNMLTREVAKERGKTTELLGTVMAIKLPLAIVSLLSVYIMINLMGYSELARHLVYIASVSMVLDSFSSTFVATIRGFHNLKYESISSIIYQLIIFVLGLSAIKAGLGLKWLMSAIVLAGIFNFVFSLSILLFKFKIKIKLNYNFVLIKNLAKLALPFGLFVIFQRLYMYMDTVMLSTMAGDEYVGLYQVAFKIVFALQFLPMAFMAALYPAMSSYWKNNNTSLVLVFEQALKYLIIISLPISLGIIVITDKVILFFKEEYLPAIFSVQIIMLSLIFIFINFPIGSLLNACDRQKSNTWIIFIAAVSSIVLNLILIPRYQNVGASFTVLFTNCLMTVIGLSLVPKIIKYDYRSVLVVLFKALSATLFMGVIVYFLKTYLHIFLVVGIGFVIYFLVLFLLKGFRKEDVFNIYNAIIKKSI